MCVETLNDIMRKTDDGIYTEWVDYSFCNFQYTKISWIWFVIIKQNNYSITCPYIILALFVCLNSSMLMTDDCSNVSSRANSECEYQYETEHNERQRCLSLKDPVHCIPFHKYLQSQVSNHYLRCYYLYIWYFTNC